MAYFGGGSRFAGDPGFFGTLFGGVTKIARRALGVTPVGQAVGQLAKFQRPSRLAIPQIGRQRPRPGVPQMMLNGEVRPRRRRMNVGNTKALTRAIRRTDGFVRLARRSLKNTGFKIVSKSAGKVSQAAMAKAVAAAHHAK